MPVSAFSTNLMGPIARLSILQLLQATLRQSKPQVQEGRVLQQLTLSFFCTLGRNLQVACLASCQLSIACQCHLGG